MLLLLERNPYYSRLNSKGRRNNLKAKYLSLFIFFSIIVSACQADIDPKKALEDIYIVALDSIMEQDEALSHYMEYVAIDMSNFKNVSQQEKEGILNFFSEKYKIEAMDATYEQLKEKGLYNPETTSLHGVLLRIEEVEFKFNNEILFVGSKYRSGLGAVGVEVIVHYKNNKWKSKETKMMWIS